MKGNKLRESTIEYIISRVIDNAKDAQREREEKGSNDFYDGKCLAYYEVLDTIKNELIVNEVDLSQFGLDINLEDSIL
jgi:hypothetical protein